jgi:multidrug resistance efflux pump
VLRVPAHRLDAALDALAALGKEISREVRAVDVTESSADLEAHLANQKALRERLRDALERAQKVDELLMVERELARVQAEIDRVEGHRARMRTSVAQSTISLALRAEPEPAPKPKRRILGPLGAAWWVVQKLWVVRE